MTASLLLLLGSMGALAGAIAGSFLNVVIHRVPKLIDASEEGLTPLALLKGLSWPSSHCPACGHALRVRDNIPVLAYLALRGRCRFCQARFGLRYLIVELVTAAAFAYCFAAFGLTGKAVLGAGLAAMLIALIAIDLEEQLLPDLLLAPLLALGLAFQALYGAGLADAALGGAVGFGALWLVRAAYLAYAKIEGMGWGDVKFAGVIGAWVGFSAIPGALMIAFAGGVALTLPFMALGWLNPKTPVPFGPFLALGGICVGAAPGLTQAMLSVFAPY